MRHRIKPVNQVTPEIVKEVIANYDSIKAREQAIKFNVDYNHLLIALKKANFAPRKGPRKKQPLVTA